jgi:D-alanine-D-alanine ligase
MSARAAGISYEDLCLQLLASAALDHQRTERRRSAQAGTTEEAKG